jgi:DNA-binding CsgD family transcriptional regulator
MSTDASDTYAFPEPSLEHWSGIAPVPPRSAPPDPEMVAVVEELYGGLLEPERWPRAVELLAAAFGARGAQFCLGNFRQRTILAHWLHVSGLTTSADVIAWEDALVEGDPAISLCAAFPGHAFTADRCFKPETIARRKEAMNIPPSVGDMLAVGWPHNPYWSTVALWRDSTDAPFSVAEQERLATIAYDFLAIGRCLAGSLHAPAPASLGAGAAMALPTPAGVVRADGSGLQWNAAAVSWAQAGQVRAFLSSPDWKRACRLAGRGGEALARSANGEIAVRLARLTAPKPVGPQSLVNDYAEVLLLAEVLDPGAAASASRDTWQNAFGLTDAEMRVLRRIRAGSTIDDAAHKLEVSRETIRSHLRAMRRKTGRKTLSALAALAAGWD